MEAFAAAFVERLQVIGEAFQESVAGLPAEALDWSPGPEMNSLAVLATHAAAATRYLIGDVIAGDPSGRVREDEFRTAGVDAESLRRRLAEMITYAQEVVSQLSVADLEQEHLSPQHNKTVTTAWCLFRALDHLAEHLAHAQLTRMLWLQQKNQASAAK